MHVSQIVMADTHGLANAKGLLRERDIKCSTQYDRSQHPDGITVLRYYLYCFVLYRIVLYFVLRRYCSIMLAGGGSLRINMGASIGARSLPVLGAGWCRMCD